MIRKGESVTISTLHFIKSRLRKYGLHDSESCPSPFLTLIINHINHFASNINTKHKKVSWETDGGDLPENYAKPDSGFLFRFPFPDEDHMKIGDNYDYNRGGRINIIDTAVGFSKEE